MIAPFFKIRPRDPDLSQVQDNTAQTLKDVTSREILDGRLIEDITLSGGGAVKKVPHGLGRRLVGWVIVRKDAEGDVWEAESTTPTRTLVLHNSMPDADDSMTISLWVF